MYNPWASKEIYNSFATFLLYFTDRRVERSQVRPERSFADSCPADNPVTMNVNKDFQHRPNVIPENNQVPSSEIIENLDTECFPWIQVRSNINRLELRAALNMSVNILPFWLCTFPVSCCVMALYWCIRLEGNCENILLPWPYVWNLFLLHSIYNPLMYMCTSSEFWRAFIHTKNKLIGIFR